MDERAIRYRHEWKYLCTQAQWALIQSRIACLAQLDPHAQRKGHYQVRSLYFDDAENNCFFANEDGVDDRAKFRIRIYDQKIDNIQLELKEKSHGRTAKRSCELSLEQCRQLMQGIPPALEADMPFLLKRLTLLMKTRRVQPKVIVSYERVPYVYPLSNVRITFDKNIRSSNDFAGFLEEDIFSRPIMEPCQHLLEVKCDQFLPGLIAQQVQFEKMQRATFSKYYFCMKYNIGGWER